MGVGRALAGPGASAEAREAQAAALAGVLAARDQTRPVSYDRLDVDLDVNLNVNNTLDIDNKNLLVAS